MSAESSRDGSQKLKSHSSGYLPSVCPRACFILSVVRAVPLSLHLSLRWCLPWMPSVLSIRPPTPHPHPLGDFASHPTQTQGEEVKMLWRRVSGGLSMAQTAGRRRVIAAHARVMKI